MRTYGRLRELIKLRFGTLGNFAEVMGMSRSALSHKLNGLVPWKHSEIEKVCNLLDIPMTLVGEYFFYE